MKNICKYTEYTLQGSNISRFWKNTNILKSVLEMDILVPPPESNIEAKTNEGPDQNVFPSNQKRAMFTWNLGGRAPQELPGCGMMKLFS